MADITLERLAAGIKAANAKGDIDAVKKLGAAYRRLQGQQTAAPPPPTGPGAEAGQTIPGGMSTLGDVSSNLEWAPGQQPKPTAADEALSFGRGMVDLPIIGPTLADWRRGLDANIASATGHGDADTLKKIYARNDELLKAKTGGARFAGQLAGSTLALGGLGTTATGGRLLGTVGSLPSRIGFGMGSGAAVSGADTLARGGTMQDAGVSALVGAGLGGIIPAIGGVKNALGNKAAQTAATNAAIKNAPAASELKTAASQMFQAVDNAGVTVDPQSFGQFVVGLAGKARDMRINPKLDPKAYAAFEEMGAVMGEALNGKPLTLGDLHNLRQIAQRAAVSSEGRDAMFANQIVDALDGFVVKPGAMQTPNGGAVGNELLGAISTWGRARRAGLIEDAISKAQNTASGLENGLRVEFRKLLNNKKTAALFSKQEREAMETVVRGTTGANLAKLLGKFGFGAGGAGNMLGGTIGFGAGSVFGGPLGGVVAAGVGTGARKVSEKLTERAAERAAKVVATPNIPMIAAKALPQGIVPGALLPLEVTRKRKPLEITVRGGN